MRNNTLFSGLKDIAMHHGHLFRDDLSDDADTVRQCNQIYAQGNIILHE